VTIANMELTYTLSAKDRERVFEFLRRRSSAAQKQEPAVLSNPYVLLASNAFLIFMIVQWIVQLVPVVESHGVAELARGKYLAGNLIGIVLIIVVLQSLWSSAAGFLKRGGDKVPGNEGVNCGEHRLSATPNGLAVRLMQRAITYKWSAIQDIVQTKDLLLLLLTPRQAITVPRHAFKSESEEELFVEFIRRHMVPREGI
jgi:hypothetical protein